ncbi:MAG: beta-propeller domain-containing protein [Candidatus Hadarchaeaceae archaeon]
MKRWLPPVSAWYLNEEQRANLSFVTVILIVATVAALATPILIIAAGPDQISGQIQLKKFSSYEELENFVRADASDYDRYYLELSVPMPLRFADAFGWAESGGRGLDDIKYSGASEAQVDYSTTNIQVEGVDEADIVKSDGKYIYVVSGNKVVIIDAYPAENARILSEIGVNGNPVEIFINGNKLIVLGWTYVKVYDVSDRENPILTRDVSFDGHYFNSRMVGDYVYVIINSPTIYYGAEKINLPYISSNGNTKTVPATEVYYFENIPDYSYEFTTIMAINTQKDDEEITSETFLIGTTQNIFVSSNNIYITYTNNWYTPRPLAPKSITRDWETEKTVIHKISIAGGAIEYKSQGEVPGHVLNQFSMDEYLGYFRIATTTGEVWGGGAKNHVYVLDEDLNIVGRLEGIAPGERIYSARFMGDRAYLVTFKKVDPLFVIDLRDPRNPKVLGELKIPGYSDYLHPYDEDHIIGVGKDTVDAGSFAWYQGVKIALFDVSDPENPKEISKYIIGQRGTESLALQDHKAFLFSRSKNLLVIPAGYHFQQDAYVFHVSPENGLILKGTITHSENAEAPSSYSIGLLPIRISYRPSYNYSVKRSLYIDNVLYTISDELIKMNDLEDLDEVNKLEL